MYKKNLMFWACNIIHHFLSLKHHKDNSNRERPARRKDTIEIRRLHAYFSLVQQPCKKKQNAILVFLGHFLSDI